MMHEPGWNVCANIQHNNLHCDGSSRPKGRCVTEGHNVLLYVSYIYHFLAPGCPLGRSATIGAGVHALEYCGSKGCLLSATDCGLRYFSDIAISYRIAANPQILT